MYLKVTRRYSLQWKWWIIPPKSLQKMKSVRTSRLFPRRTRISGAIPSYRRSTTTDKSVSTMSRWIIHHDEHIQIRREEKCVMSSFLETNTYIRYEKLKTHREDIISWLKDVNSVISLQRTTREKIVDALMLAHLNDDEIAEMTNTSSGDDEKS